MSKYCTFIFNVILWVHFICFDYLGSIFLSLFDKERKEITNLVIKFKLKKYLATLHIYITGEKYPFPLAISSNSQKRNNTILLSKMLNVYFGI